MSEKDNKSNDCFANLLKNPEMEKLFFKNYLSTDILNMIDFDTSILERVLDPDVLSFSNMEITYSALFSVRSKKCISALLLIYDEDIFHPNKYMPINMIHSATGFFIEYMRKNPNEPEPLIVSLIYQHGEQPYSYLMERSALLKRYSDFLDKCIFRAVLGKVFQGTDKPMNNSVTGVLKIVNENYNES